MPQRRLFKHPIYQSTNLWPEVVYLLFIIIYYNMSSCSGWLFNGGKEVMLFQIQDGRLGHLTVNKA